MRVSELANELGKTSKEVLDIIKQKDSSASLFAASSVSKDQENMVRNAVSQKKEGAPKAEAEKAEPAKKTRTRCTGFIMRLISRFPSCKATRFLRSTGAKKRAF